MNADEVRVADAMAAALRDSGHDGDDPAAVADCPGCSALADYDALRARQEGATQDAASVVNAALSAIIARYQRIEWAPFKWSVEISEALRDAGLIRVEP